VTSFPKLTLHATANVFARRNTAFGKPIIIRTSTYFIAKAEERKPSLPRASVIASPQLWFTN
jgi:hypothetical protein